LKIPITIQMQPGENGAAALCMMLGYYRRFVPLKEMREHCVSSRNGSSPEQILKAAGKYALKAKIEKLEISNLRFAKFPIMVLWKRRYYAIIEAIKGDLVYIADPAKGEYKITLKKFGTLYSGTAVVFEKSENFTEGGKRESLFSLLKSRLKMMAKSAVLLTILSVLSIFINLAIPEGNKRFLDQFVGAKNFNQTEKLIVEWLLYFFMLALLICTMLRTKLIDKTSRDMSAYSGSHLFKKLFAQPMRFFEQYSAGELMSRFDNNIKLDNSVIKTLVPRAIDAFMTFFYLTILLMYNPIITGMCVLLYLVHIVISLKIQEKTAINARSLATNSGTLDSSILNGMNMMDTIISSGAERRFYNMWHDAQQQKFDSRKDGYKLTALSAFASNINNYLTQAVQLFVGAYFILNGSMTLGVLSLFQSYLNNFKTSTNNCLDSMNTLQTMRTNIERINDITDRETRKPRPLLAQENENLEKLTGNLKVEHVTFRYNPADPPAVDDVSLEVLPGQMIALVGSTGCGKSTLLKILSDLYSPSEGKILYGGKEREEIPDVIFNTSVMTVDQETVMFEDSIHSNIRMWDKTIENFEVILAAKDAQIHERIMRDPQEYGAMISENGSNFSGGEVQRLELARALSHEPTILLLDEFTSALDALTEDRVIKALRDKGTTCIIVAHRLSAIVDCDQIYVMDKGRVIQHGTHDELYNQEGLYRSLIKMQ